MSSGAIIPARTAIETFRDAGYKNTASALAELIDNSIEANAEDIQVFTFEEQVPIRERTLYQIQEVGVYDNGCGMSPDVLSICLQFGNGTRLQSRSGIGRFGIGLPNASVSQARRVEVYSWQNSECFHTYLDVDEVKEQDLSTVNPVIPGSIPDKYLSNIDGALPESGTLIIWKKCDRLDMSRSRTLYKALNQDLCRIYRHFLDDDELYGEQVSIKLVSTGKAKEVLDLRANDPLYLMVPCNTPGHADEATNIMHGDVVTIPIEYDYEGGIANVEIRFSIALPETQSEGGGSALGQHYARNTGISFVRAAREIDFGSFGYYNDRDERERWWGCEIRFEPVLDELFGVTNNKQAVRGVGYLDEKEFRKEHPEDWKDILHHDLKMKLRHELSRVFSQNHKQMMDAIKSRGAGKRGTTPTERAKADKSTRIANKELEGLSLPTKSLIEGQSKSNDEKIVEWQERLLEGDTTLHDSDAKKVAAEKIALKIEKDFSSWPGAQFFSVEVTGGTCVLVVNRKHPFFTDLYEPLMDVGDDKYIEAMDLALMSYARMEDELYSRTEDLDEIREVWGRHLKHFLIELRKHA